VRSPSAHTRGVTSQAQTLPLWGRVLEDLRARISAGEFETRFPGDLELVAHYRVSRHTVREAVRHLQSDGILERRRGRGSFITPAPIEQPLGNLYSLFRSIEAAGLTQESVVRYLRRARNATAATMLGCPGQWLVYLERLRLAGTEPIALDCAWLPASLAEPLLEVDFRHTALYEQLATRCGIRLTSGWEKIHPVLPDRTQRELLGIDAHEPAFGIERLAYRDDTPVEWRHSVVRGDRFSFVARWANEQQGTTFEPTTNG
jgi:GntR family transcriptional regulator